MGWLKDRRASGSEPATSPRPPTLTKGAASAARNKTLIIECVLMVTKFLPEAEGAQG